MVIGAHDVQAAISKTVDDVARDKAHTLQIISLILILLYTGVRLGSVIAPDKQYAEEWKFLRWKVRRLKKIGSI